MSSRPLVDVPIKALTSLIAMLVCLLGAVCGLDAPVSITPALELFVGDTVSVQSLETFEFLTAPASSNSSGIELLQFVTQPSNMSHFTIMNADRPSTAPSLLVNRQDGGWISLLSPDGRFVTLAHDAVGMSRLVVRTAVREPSTEFYVSALGNTTGHVTIQGPMPKRCQQFKISCSDALGNYLHRFQELGGITTMSSYPQFDQDAGLLMRRGNLSLSAWQAVENIYYSLPKAAVRCTVLVCTRSPNRSTRLVASGVQTLINR